MSSKLVASIGLKKRKKAGRENFQINNSGFKIKEKKKNFTRNKIDQVKQKGREISLNGANKVLIIKILIWLFFYRFLDWAEYSSQLPPGFHIKPNIVLSLLQTFRLSQK